MELQMYNSESGEDWVSTYNIDATVADVLEAVYEETNTVHGSLFAQGIQLCMSDKLCDTSVTSDMIIVYTPHNMVIFGNFNIPYAHRHSHADNGETIHDFIIQPVDKLINTITNIIRYKRKRFTLSEDDMIKTIRIQISACVEHDVSICVSTTMIAMKSMIKECKVSPEASKTLYALV
jgi:hypothetical protein